MTISARYTPTAWTILGFLSFAPRNGYQLKQAVERSVGHFWGVSYGQLYPQLKALAADGLIASGPDATWRLTADGAAALRGWLAEEPEPATRRDEGLVKLLFSDHAGPAITASLVAARRREARARRDQAAATEPGAHWPPDHDRDPADLLSARLVRSHTLALADAELAWCDAADAMIAGHRA